MSSMVHTLPKVDLCCSLVGTVDAALLTEFGAASDVATAAARLAAVGQRGVSSWYTDLDGVAAALQRPGQIEAIAYALAQRLIRDAVVHVELHVDLLRPALPPGEVLAAIERGFERAVEEDDEPLLSWAVVAELRRGDDATAAADALAALRVEAGKRLVAVALCGDETVPAGELASVLAAARGQELPLVATAGLGGGLRELRATLALEPARLLFGHALLRDEELVTEVRARRLPVVSMPSWERRLGLGRAGAPPVVGRLLEAGLFATVASGAPGALHAPLSAVYEQLSQELGWRLDQLRTVTARAVEVAFLPPKLRFVVARAVENWRHRPRLTAGPTDDGYGM